MRKASYVATILAAVLSAAAAYADTFSTSALNPSQVPANGVIAGSFPPGGAETTFYFAADLKAGDLATQISMLGRPGRDKSLEIGLVDPAGKERAEGELTGLSGPGASGQAVRKQVLDQRWRARRVDLGRGLAGVRPDARPEHQPRGQERAEPVEPV